MGYRPSRIDGQTPVRQFAATLLVQVQHDRDTLRELTECIGGSSSGLKDVPVWLTEKVSRLKLYDDSGEGLGTFEVVEFLEPRISASW